jgi:hypothetical protein
MLNLATNRGSADIIQKKNATIRAQAQVVANARARRREQHR